jgi:ribosomal silencing factor RsfS
MIQGDEAVVEYLENKKRRYFKISLLWKKSERVPM